MREVEVKGVVPDEAASVARLEKAGARLVFAGRLTDRRYDTPDRQLFVRDEVVRIRVAEFDGERRARLDFKGPASWPDGYKVREEVGSDLGDPGPVERTFAAIGLVVTREIEREITTFDFEGAVVRFERYPRMDTLVEVEGNPESIERAIVALGIPRGEFSGDRLADFVRRFEARTGGTAALSGRELAGDYPYRPEDA